MSDSPINAPAAPAAPAPAPSGDAVADAIAGRRAQQTAPVAPQAPEGVKPKPTIPNRADEAPGFRPPTAFDDADAAVEEGVTPAGDAPEGDDPDADAPEGGEDGPDWEKIPLPGRRPGEPDLMLEIDPSDTETIQRVQQMVNGYERKRDSEARLEYAHKMMDEAREFQAMVQIDPVSVVERTLDPERQSHLALRILSNPEMFQTLAPTLKAMLTDENARSVVAAHLEAESYKLKERAQQEVRETQFAERNARDIRRAIDALCPATLPAAQRELWRQDALNSVTQYVTQHNLRQLHPMDLPVVLAARLRAMGMDPQQGAALLQQTFTGKSARPGGSPAPTNRPQPTAENFQRASSARRAAAAAAPGGAGAPTAQMPKPPANMGVKEAANWARQQRGLPTK